MAVFWASARCNLVAYKKHIAQNFTKWSPFYIKFTNLNLQSWYKNIFITGDFIKFFRAPFWKKTSRRQLLKLHMKLFIIIKAYEDSFVEWFNNESTLTHSFEKDLNPPRISVQNLIIVSPNRRKKDIKMPLCLSNPMWKRY